MGARLLRCARNDGWSEGCNLIGISFKAAADQPAVGLGRDRRAGFGAS